MLFESDDVEEAAFFEKIMETGSLVVISGYFQESFVFQWFLHGFNQFLLSSLLVRNVLVCL